MDAHALGRYLRESREAKELTLENAVSTLKIRQYILESFERGEFHIAEFSPVQIRGFIRNYAGFLGLDDDLVIQYYESSLHPGRKRRGRKNKRERRNGKRPPQDIPVAPRSLTDTNPTLPRVTMAEERETRQERFLRALNMVMVLLVAVAALAVIVFVVFQLIEQPDNAVESENPGILGQLPPTATFTVAPTFTPRPTVSALPQIQQNFDGRGVMVTIEVRQRAWLRVLTDGNVQIARLVLPGEILEYRSLNEILVSSSNAEALNIVYNGQQQGTFGGRGQAVDITFTTADMQIVTGPGFEPTSPFTATPLPTDDHLAETLVAAQTPSITPGPSPTITLTPTITDTPSITPTPSDSPTPSDTPTITPTPSDTATPTNTPTVTNTPTNTNTPTITPTPSATFTPSPTAILPPRATSENPTPVKGG